MITQNTPTLEFLREFKEDYKKALYWNRKQYRGENNLERAKKERKVKAMRMRQDMFGDVIDYHSPNGNRWRIMDMCKYYPNTNQTSECTFAFMYWDTYGSVGSVAPLFGSDPYEPSGAMMFTSHFFLRVAQRKNIKAIDSYLVLAFMMQNPMMNSQIGKDNNGNDCIDMCSSDGLCRGYFRTDDDGNVNRNLIEFRTFLNDSQLSPGQLKHTKKLRESRQFIDARPADLKMESIILADDPKESMDKYCENMFRAQGAPKYYGKNYSNAIFHLGLSMTEFNTHPNEDEIIAQYNKGSIINKCSDAVQELIHRKKNKWCFVDLLGICFDNIPGYEGNLGLIRYSEWATYNETGNELEAIAAGKDVERWLNNNNIVLTKDNYLEIMNTTKQLMEEADKR